MGLVHTVALDIELLRDCDTGETHLRCACGEWWSITQDRSQVGSAVLDALKHYANHDAEHVSGPLLCHGEHPHEFERRSGTEITTVRMTCGHCPVCTCPNAAYGEHGTRSPCVLCGWRLP